MTRFPARLPAIGIRATNNDTRASTAALREAALTGWGNRPAPGAFVGQFTFLATTGVKAFSVGRALLQGCGLRSGVIASQPLQHPSWDVTAPGATPQLGCGRPLGQG